MSPADGSGGNRRRGRRPTQEEVELWRRTVRDAKPLRHAKKSPRRDQASGESGSCAGGSEPAPAPSRKSERPAPAPAARPKPETRAKGLERPPPLVVGDLTNVDRRTAERLRRGRMEISARLDLHGMTRAAAQRSLEDFMHVASERDLRCVLVITGKGTFSEAGGVLRREVPRWLNLPHLRAKVVACVEAQQRHGGEGALYVLLRRRRGG